MYAQQCKHNTLSSSLVQTRCEQARGTKRALALHMQKMSYKHICNADIQTLDFRRQFHCGMPFDGLSLIIFSD